MENFSKLINLCKRLMGFYSAFLIRKNLQNLNTKFLHKTLIKRMLTLRKHRIQTNSQHAIFQWAEADNSSAPQSLGFNGIAGYIYNLHFSIQVLVLYWQKHADVREAATDQGQSIMDSITSRGEHTTKTSTLQDTLYQSLPSAQLGAAANHPHVFYLAWVHSPRGYTSTYLSHKIPCNH